MLLKTETYNQQSKLAQYCRTGIASDILEVKANRLPHYRRLVFNVVKDALETTFPIAFKFLQSEVWEEIVYNFFCLHNCQHTQVWRMPEEFYQFCRNESYTATYDLPYLNDLLYFEWLEAEMYVMEDLEYPNFSENTNWLKGKIAVNPEHKIIKLEYPVHFQIPDEAVKNKGNYFLLLYREKETGKVQFVNLSILFTFLVENIVLQEKTLEEIFNDILHIFGINNLDLLQKEAFKFLEDLLQRGFVLGILQE